MPKNSDWNCFAYALWYGGIFVVCGALLLLKWNML